MYRRRRLKRFARCEKNFQSPVARTLQVIFLPYFFIVKIRVIILIIRFIAEIIMKIMLSIVAINSKSVISTTPFHKDWGKPPVSTSPISHNITNSL